MFTELHHLPHRHTRRQIHRQELLNYVLPFQRRLLLQYNNKVRIVTAHRRHQGPALERKDSGDIGVTIDRHRPGNLLVVLNLGVHVVITNKQEWELVITKRIDFMGLPQQFRMEPIRYNQLV